MVGSAHRLLDEDLLQPLIAGVNLFLGTLIVESGDVTRIFTLVASSLILACVVVPFDYAVINSPSVGVGHPTTVAGVVRVIAVEQVLHREVWWFTAIVNRVQCFKRCGRREGPARTANRLVDVSIRVYSFFFPTKRVRKCTRGCLFGLLDFFFLAFVPPF